MTNGSNKYLDHFLYRCCIKDEPLSFFEIINISLLKQKFRPLIGTVSHLEIRNFTETNSDI